MSKKSHSHRHQATYLISLSHMTNEEVMALAIAMPVHDARFGSVYAEMKKRKQCLMQELIDAAPSAGVSSEEAAAMFQDICSDETFNRFLDETGNRQTFELAVEQATQGDEDVLRQVVANINERHARQN